MQPPAPEHPQPAPGWILGEDGHWRPPPFTAGPGPRPAPAPGAGGGGTGGTGGGRSPGSGRRSWRDRLHVVWGLVVVVVAIAGAAGGARELYGFIRPGQETYDPTTDEATEGDPILDQEMDRRARAVLGPDGDPVCPSIDWVTATTEVPIPADQIVREGIERSVNGVDLSGIECRYGDQLRLGKLDGVEERVRDLYASEGPVTVQEGPFPGSVRFDDAATGMATFVFEDRDAVIEAFVVLPIDHAGDVGDLSTATMN